MLVTSALKNFHTNLGVSMFFLFSSQEPVQDRQADNKTDGWESPEKQPNRTAKKLLAFTDMKLHCLDR